MWILLATLAHASPLEPPQRFTVDLPSFEEFEGGEPIICLTPHDFDRRVLEPLRHLVRCSREVDIQAGEIDVLSDALRRSREAERAAEAARDRARRQRPWWAAGGAAVASAAAVAVAVAVSR